ncbi:permease [Nitratifractor sp.]
MGGIESGCGGLRLRGFRFLGVVAALYLALALYDPHRCMAALRIAGETLATILPILAVVIVISAAIFWRFDPREFAKRMERHGAKKRRLFALVAGVLSHGPMYAWYPLIGDLRRHGVGDGEIATFFFARAVKVPIFPLMVHYFGWPFSVFLTLYILVGAWIQGILVDRIERGIR